MIRPRYRPRKPFFSLSDTRRRLLDGRLLVRSGCFWLCIIYVFTNVAFAHKPEANFWSERKAAVQETRLASLPASFQLPSPSSGLLSTPRIDPLSSLKGKGYLNSFPFPGRKGRNEEDITPFLELLSSSYGSIRNVSVPPGRHSEAKPENLVVIHIQDVHRNPEAQANIRKTLQELLDSGKVSLVALEGAFQPLDLSPARKFPYPGSIKAVSDYLLKEKKISGAMYAALNSRKDVPFVGVDQKDRYFANVEAYKKSAPLVREYKGLLSALEAALSEKKARVFNPELLEFDRKAEAYRKGTLKVGEYVRFLALDNSYSLKKDKEEFSSIQTFLEALDLESRLDFNQVE